MPADAALATAVPADARCSIHPDRAAAAVCARCGAFGCDLDRQLIGGKLYCPTCAARPEMDDLEAFRLKYWGKRDGWAWLMGIGSIPTAILAVMTIASGLTKGTAGALLLGSLLVAQAAIQSCYFFGMKWARWAVFTVPLLALVTTTAKAGLFFLGFLSLLAYVNTRNRLFFRVEVTRQALQKEWDLYSDNPEARTGRALGILSVLCGVFGPFGLILSIIALSRVDPNAHPPVGGKDRAIAGIVLSIIGMALWGAIIVADL